MSIRFSLSMEMSRLTREGTAEPVSRDRILRHEHGEGNTHFPCLADHVQDWQPYPVDPYSCYMYDRTIRHPLKKDLQSRDSNSFYLLSWTSYGAYFSLREKARAIRVSLNFATSICNKKHSYSSIGGRGIRDLTYLSLVNVRDQVKLLVRDRKFSPFLVGAKLPCPEHKLVLSKVRF